MNEIEILGIIIKIALVVATVFHVLVSLVVLSQVRTMNRLVRTRPGGCLLGCMILIIFLLILVFLGVIFYF